MKHTCRIGLIGCGRIAQLVHVPALHVLPQARIAAVADPVAAAREAVRRRLGTVAECTDYRELLRVAELDAVVICAPTGLHAEMAVAALEAGKHVYIEKPLAADLEAARRVVEAWRRSGRVCMLGFNYRYHPLYRKARSLIRRGQLGRPTALRSRFTTGGHALPEWKQRRATGGGVLLDLAAHHLDLMEFLLDDRIREIVCRLESRQTEEDTATLDARTERGVTLSSFFALNLADEDWMEIAGSRRKLFIDRLHSVEIRWAAPDAEFRPLAGWNRWAGVLRGGYSLRKALNPSFEPSYGRALTAFVRAVHGEPFAGPDPGDGYRNLAAVIGAERSARTGSPFGLASGEQEA